MASLMRANCPCLLLILALLLCVLLHPLLLASLTAFAGLVGSRCTCTSSRKTGLDGTRLPVICYSMSGIVGKLGKLGTKAHLLNCAATLLPQVLTGPELVGRRSMPCVCEDPPAGPAIGQHAAQREPPKRARWERLTFGRASRSSPLIPLA